MKQNHAIQRIKKISHSLLVFSAMLLVAACSLHDDYELPPASLEPNVTFQISVPKVNTPSTYGMSTTQETKVNEMTVLAYKSINGTEQLIQKIPVVSVSSSGIIKVIMPAGEYNRLVLIANANTQVATLALNSNLTALNSLEYIHTTGKWDTTTPDYIPMSGELVAEALNGIEIKQGIPKLFEDLILTRMLAKINFHHGIEPDFILKEVYLYNMKRNGLIVKNANYSATPAQPNLPSTLQKATSPITYTVTGIYFHNEIYVFESAAPTTATLGATSPRIIIKGTYKNEGEFYYPVDFTYGSQTGTTRGDFRPIVRNHRYHFSINKVLGIGFSTAEEALACTEVFTNIETKIVEIDDDFTNVYHDRYNFLAVNATNSNIVMGKAAYNAKKNDNTITVLTDAANFTIECYNKNGTLAAASKMKANQTSYVGGIKTDAYLIANYETTGMNTTEFEGYVIVKAGELQSEKIPVYKVWCGIIGVPIINSIGQRFYKTHRYPTSASGTMECWMVENSMEGIGSGKGYGLDWEGNSIGKIWSSDRPEERGQVKGYYYTWEQRNNACPAGWSVPSTDQWGKLKISVEANYTTNNTAVWWMGPRGETNGAFAGSQNFTEATWGGWNRSAYPAGRWWEASARVGNIGIPTTFWRLTLTGGDVMWYSVRCVKN